MCLYFSDCIAAVVCTVIAIPITPFLPMVVLIGLPYAAVLMCKEIGEWSKKTTTKSKHTKSTSCHCVSNVSLGAIFGGHCDKQDVYYRRNSSRNGTARKQYPLAFVPLCVASKHFKNCQ